MPDQDQLAQRPSGCSGRAVSSRAEKHRELSHAHASGTLRLQSEETLVLSEVTFEGGERPKRSTRGFFSTLTRGQKVGLVRQEPRGRAKSDFGRRAPRRSSTFALITSCLPDNSLRHPLRRHSGYTSLSQPRESGLPTSPRVALSPAPRPPRSGWAWQRDHPLPFPLQHPPRSVCRVLGMRQACVLLLARLVRDRRRCDTRGIRSAATRERRWEMREPPLDHSFSAEDSSRSTTATRQTRRGRTCAQNEERFASRVPRTETCEGRRDLRTR